MSRDIVEKAPSKTIGRTTTTNTVHSGAGIEQVPLETLRAHIGQDIEVTYRVNMSTERVFVGKLVGIADRASTANPPDLVIKNRSPNLILINTSRVVKVRSTMELLGVWDLNPMELASVGYEAWKAASGATREWLDLPPIEKEMWLACSEAVRDAVNQGI